MSYGTFKYGAAVVECGADVERIISVALRLCNLSLAPAGATALWEDFSERQCASWLYLPDADEELAEVIKECVYD